MAEKKDYIQLNGEVVKALPNATFLVKLENEQTMTCFISGKIRKHMINIVPGDKVNVEVSIYDPTKGRITYRIKE